VWVERNDIIHKGANNAAVTAADVMQALCAANFSFEYMRYIGQVLTEGAQVAGG